MISGRRYKGAGMDVGTGFAYDNGDAPFMTSSLQPIAHHAPIACRVASTGSSFFAVVVAWLRAPFTSVIDIPHLESPLCIGSARLRGRCPSSPIRRPGSHGWIRPLPEAAIDGAVGGPRAHRNAVQGRLQVGLGLLGLARDGPRRPARVPGAACKLAPLVCGSGDNARPRECAGLWVRRQALLRAALPAGMPVHPITRRDGGGHLMDLEFRARALALLMRVFAKNAACPKCALAPYGHY